MDPSTGASASAAALQVSVPEGCSGELQLRSASNSTEAAALPVALAAAFAYAHSAAQIHGIRCELRSAPSAGSPGDVIALAQAAALTIEPAVPAPRDIFLFRQTLGSLLSLRTGGSERVRPADSTVFLLSARTNDASSNTSSDGSSLHIDVESNGTSTASVPVRVNDVVTAGAGTGEDASTPAPNATALALSHALAAAAVRLSARDRLVSSSAPTALASAPVTGRTVLVITLDTRSLLHRPSLLHARDAAASYSAAALEVGALVNASAGVNGSAVATAAGVSAAVQAPACTAEGRSAAAAVISAVPAPRQRLVVSMGGIRARTLWTAPDGSQIHVETPSYADLCGQSTAAGSGRGYSGGSGCGYQAVSLAYEQEESESVLSPQPAEAAAAPATSSSTVPSGASSRQLMHDKRKSAISRSPRRPQLPAVPSRQLVDPSRRLQLSNASSIASFERWMFA